MQEVTGEPKEPEGRAGEIRMALPASLVPALHESTTGVDPARALADDDDAEDEALPPDELQVERARQLASADAREAAIGERQHEILRAARIYSRQIAARNAERCEVDWLYSLLYNFSDADMDPQLASIIAHVAHSYSLTLPPLAPPARDDPANPVERPVRTFIAQTLAYVRDCTNVPAKQFLVLALTAMDGELQRVLRLTCPDQNIDDLLAALPHLQQHMTNVPFNRGNVGAYVAQFLRAAKDAYFKGVTASDGSPSLLNLQRSGKMSIDSMGM